ncbi:MAG: hypothetical protein QOF78_3151 [Phycisphaerales bacterium]|nr:hypothetical protein [Phycisphaerales bacterium]
MPRRSNHPEPPRAWRYIRRALHLRCPECGISPIFVPARKVRSLFDWFRPLDGCPRCGYAYEREQGYFLLAVWGLNYGLIAGIGVIMGLIIQHKYRPGLWSPWWLMLAWMPVASFLFARHAKALFLALDHYLDPHVAGKLPPRAADRDQDHAFDDDDGHEHPSQW